MHAYSSGHVHSLTVASAFASGVPCPLLVGAGKLMDGPMFTYGCLRGLDKLLKAAHARGSDWYYGDNGYFRPGHYDGHYRITRNAYQHDGSGPADAGAIDRWRALGLSIRPWRTTGRHVLVCPPGQAYGTWKGFDAGSWAQRTLAELPEHTDRPIHVRTKDSRTPLARELRDCWCLVTHSSNVAVEALLAGVPVICTDACAAQSMGRTRLADIENPLLPDDRERWAARLAANQWTLDEMRSGRCWSDLNG